MKGVGFFAVLEFVRVRGLGWYCFGRDLGVNGFWLYSLSLDESWMFNEMIE